MPNEPTDMGVDVGLKLHVVVRTRPDDDGRTQALFAGEIASFEVLDDLMNMYRVRICVIDALPETHKAREFARRWHGKVCLAYYDRHEGDHEWSGGSSSTDERTVHINRTQALDEMFERFKQGKAELPVDARQLGGWPKNGIGEYCRHMTALKRVLKQNAQGNWVARYVDPEKADHYAHAEVYCMLAGKAGTTRTARGKIYRPRTF